MGTKRSPKTTHGLNLTALLDASPAVGVGEMGKRCIVQSLKAGRRWKWPAPDVGPIQSGWVEASNHGRFLGLASFQLDRQFVLAGDNGVSLSQIDGGEVLVVGMGNNRHGVFSGHCALCFAAVAEKGVK